jgi:hypothetical protein
MSAALARLIVCPEAQGAGRGQEEGEIQGFVPGLLKLKAEGRDPLYENEASLSKSTDASYLSEVFRNSWLFLSSGWKQLLSLSSSGIVRLVMGKCAALRGLHYGKGSLISLDCGFHDP